MTDPERFDCQYIRDICARYAISLDERNWAALDLVFAADATMTFAHVGEVCGVTAIADTCRAALEKLDASQHLVGTILPVIDNEQQAQCTSYFQAQHVRAGTEGGEQLLVGGRYDDELVRSSHGWRIVRRAQSIIWMSGNERVVF